MIEIPLTQGKIALVDDKYIHLSQHNWFAVLSGRKTSQGYYAAHMSPKINKIRKTVYLHRNIMELELGRSLIKGEEIDHINHNGLDNQCSNLRLVTRKQNSYNQRQNTTQKYSQYKGVTWRNKSKKWIARIRVDNRLKHLGCFIDEIEAAKAYDKASIDEFGIYACLNFPEDT